MKKKKEKPVFKNEGTREYKGALFDAHVHLHYDLHDGLITPAQLVRITKKKGFNVVLAMNHDTVAGARTVERLSREAGLPCLVGIEVSTIFNHVLGYGVQEWPYRRDSWDPEAVIDFLREQDAAIFLAHPCNTQKGNKWTPDIANRLDVDGIEWNNASNTVMNRDTAKMFHGYPPGRRIAGTDAHTPWTFGWAYTQVASASTNPDDVVAAMQKGLCRPCGQYVPLPLMIWEQLYIAVKNKVVKRFKVGSKWIVAKGDMPGSIVPEGLPLVEDMPEKARRAIVQPLAEKWKQDLLLRPPLREW